MDNKFIYASALLVDNEIMFFCISSLKKEKPSDYEKFFYYCAIDMEKFMSGFGRNYKCVYKEFEITETTPSMLIGTVFAENWFAQWKISKYFHPSLRKPYSTINTRRLFYKGIKILDKEYWERWVSDSYFLGELASIDTKPKYKEEQVQAEFALEVIKMLNDNKSFEEINNCIERKKDIFSQYDLFTVLCTFCKKGEGFVKWKKSRIVAKTGLSDEDLKIKLTKEYNNIIKKLYESRKRIVDNAVAYRIKPNKETIKYGQMKVDITINSKKEYDCK